MNLVLAQAAAAPEADLYLTWGFVLTGAALGLLCLEVFVPSGGMLGLLCGLAAIASIICFFKYDPTFGVAALAAYVVLTPVLVVFLFKVWINSPLAKRMVLGGDVGALAEGEDEGMEGSEKARLQKVAELRRLIGAEGVTETALRPVGVVKINGRRIDALAESGVLEPDTPVVVTDVYDNQVKVRQRTES